MSVMHGRIARLRERLTERQLDVRSEKIQRRKEEKEAARLLARAKNRRRSKPVAP